MHWRIILPVTRPRWRFQNLHLHYFPFLCSFLPFLFWFSFAKLESLLGWLRTSIVSSGTAPLIKKKKKNECINLLLGCDALCWRQFEFLFLFFGLRHGSSLEYWAISTAISTEKSKRLILPWLYNRGMHLGRWVLGSV